MVYTLNQGVLQKKRSTPVLLAAIASLPVKIIAGWGRTFKSGRMIGLAMLAD